MRAETTDDIKLSIEEVGKLGLSLINSWEDAVRQAQDRRARLRRLPEIRDIT